MLLLPTACLLDPAIVCVNGNTLIHPEREPRFLPTVHIAQKPWIPAYTRPGCPTTAPSPTCRGLFCANNPSPNSPFLIEAEPIRTKSNWLSCGTRRGLKWGHAGLEARPLDRLIKDSISSTPYQGWAPGSQTLSREVAQCKACGACTGVATRWGGQKWGWGQRAEEQRERN